MAQQIEPGLGELLRHLTELVDRGAEEIYDSRALVYRARFTPVMRVLRGGACTIGDITSRVQITQGAVSQTVRLMEEDGLVRKRSGTDGRQTAVSLTRKGTKLLSVLETHWQITFRAIDALESDLGIPLRVVLSNAITALERKSFSERLREISAQNPRLEASDAS